MAVHRPQLGRFFEDFVVGDSYQHPLGRTISEADNTWFTLLTMNTNQYHFNAHASELNPITKGRVIVNSGLTVAMVLGISVIDISQHAIANLGWKSIELKHPLYVGDTLYGESLVLSVRESKSYPYAGIAGFRTRGLNQDGEEIISWERTVMINKRSSGIDDVRFPLAKTGPMQDGS